MKLRLVLAASLLIASGLAAHAMTRAASPAKFSIPFANSAPTSSTTPGGATYPLPTPSQIGITNCAASLTDGFPAKTMQSVSSGGCPPFGQDMNGIIKQISQWSQQTQGGSLPAYDSAFSSAIGGYPEGSMLSQASNPSCLWISSVDNNTSDPDTGGGGWTGSCPGGGVSTTASTGSANAQVVTATPFVIQVGSQICWKPGFTNTGALQINVNGAGLTNVYQRLGGLIALTGGEVLLNSMTCARSDGTQWELDTSAANASLVQPDQTLSGGANVTSYSLGTGSGGGTVTMDCGKGPLESITNAGNFTFAAPAADGSCDVKVTNNSAAGTISFSGFTTNANTGEPFTTTNGNIFIVHFERIAGTSTWINKALQ